MELGQSVENFTFELSFELGGITIDDFFVNKHKEQTFGVIRDFAEKIVPHPSEDSLIDPNHT